MHIIDRFIVYSFLIYLLAMCYVFTCTHKNTLMVLEANAEYISNSADHIVNHNQRLKQIEKRLYNNEEMCYIHK